LHSATEERPPTEPLPTIPSTLALGSDEVIADLPAPPFARQSAGALGAAAACWGVAGQGTLLLVAVLKLSRAALAGLTGPGIGAVHWALAAASVAFLCYFQGYRGFQRRYAPFVAARAAHLARHPRLAHAIAAPFYACGLLHASPRRRAATTLLYVTMAALAIGLTHLPHPYRAIVDLGVACGLLWGAVSLLVFASRAAVGLPPAVALDLPDPPRR
jgi:hypothetical protein